MSNPEIPAGMKPIDWTKPLVAVHPDGRRVDVDLDGHFDDGDYFVRCENMPSDCPHGYSPDGTYANGAEHNKWRIENRAKAPAYPAGMTPEIAEKMVAEIKGATQYADSNTDAYLATMYRHWQPRLKAIMAELEPADPIGTKARQWAVDNADNEMVRQYMEQAFRAGHSAAEATP